jgi:ATP-dependent Clp protease protease subunit
LQKPKERNLFLTKEISKNSIGEIVKEIVDINENDEYLKKIFDIHGFKYVPKPIKIFIDSPGGEVYPCFGLLSIIESSKTPIYTYAVGHAMSCGFLILIMGKKRFAYKLSSLVYHQIASAVWGDVKQLEEEMIEIKRLQEKVEKIVLDKTKISKEKLEENYDMKRDLFFDLDEAIKLGIIDEII